MLSQKPEYGLSALKLMMTNDKAGTTPPDWPGRGGVSCHMLGSSHITTELTRLKSLNTE